MACAGHLDVGDQAQDVQLLSVSATGAVKEVVNVQVYQVSIPVTTIKRWQANWRLGAGLTYNIDKLVVRIVFISVWLRSRYADI